MSEELHIRLPMEDAKVIRKLVEKGEFASITEVARFAIKQFLHTYRFDTEVAQHLKEDERNFLFRAIQPSKEEAFNLFIIRERKKEIKESDKWIYMFGAYEKKQLYQRLDKLINMMSR
jgi:Arc/MetJ-type ribon-helix-helix transcriptional regulator